MLRRDYEKGYRDGVLDSINEAEAMAQQCKRAGDMAGYFHHRKIARRLKEGLADGSQ